MKRSPAATYNVITALFGLLSVLSCACIGSLLVLRPPALGRQVAVLPPTIVAPTDTQTYTPSATLTPSLTFTPTSTPTPLPTNTMVPTNTIVPTDTLTPSDIPTVAPTVANTPSIVNTAVATKTGKGTPAAAGPNLLFAPASDVVAFSPNPDPTTGCNIMAIAGQILDQNNKPITSKVSVFIAGPNNFKKLAYPSTVNVPPFGVGFWLLQIKTKVNSNAYTVEVLDSKQNQISSPMTVQFTADCQNNIAIINFQQTVAGPIP